MAMTDSKPAGAAKGAAQQTADNMSSTAADVNATFTRAAEQAGSAAEAMFSHGKFDMPEAMRSFAEQGLAQGREAYGRMKSATEEATGVMEDSLENTRAHLRDMQVKAIDAAKAQADASFELARKLLTVTSVADAMQLQSSFARERFEALVDYSKDVQGLVGKAGAEVSRPVKTMMERTLNQTKS